MATATAESTRSVYNKVKDPEFQSGVRQGMANTYQSTKEAAEAGLKMAKDMTGPSN